MSDLDRFVAELERHRQEFCKVVNEMSARGDLERANRAIARLNRKIKKARGEDRKRLVILQADLAAETLLTHGATGEFCDYFRRVVVEGWLETLDCGEEIDLAEVFQRVAREWTALLEGDLHAKQVKVKRIKWLRGAVRLSLGGGALIFDCSKALILPSVPEYALSSWFAAATFLEPGISRLFLDN